MYKPEYSIDLGIYMLDRMWNEHLISMEDFETMFIILNAMHDEENIFNEEDEFIFKSIVCFS